MIPELEKFYTTEVGDKAFFCISRDHTMNESRDSVGEIPLP